MTGEVKPIAVLGLSCRFPGTASSPEGLWRTCAEQHDIWQPMPNERLSNHESYHPDPARNGTSNVRGAHFLAQHPGLFDAAFFNITAAEAKAMDPQQRILLELAYEALENAGITLHQISGSNTGVFIGSSCRDYADIVQGDPHRTELFQSTGAGQTMLANRISYFFDLKGPSAAVDTACSSSLVALHLACTSLRAGEIDMAIVGGANLILDHGPMIALSKLRFLSPDGRCFTYDKRANGFGRGEGAGCLVLKPLDDALEHGDNVRAVIRNSGSNQDGKTVGISLPSGRAQTELLTRDYNQAGLDPIDTGYVEAHGTGTQVGDPIEAASISKVFSTTRPSDSPLLVGSVKSNIGHLEGASGIAGVVKTILMLEKGLILPNFDFRSPNDSIPLRDWKLEIPRAIMNWPGGNVRRASVINFGFGGSNAHVILERPSKASTLRSFEYSIISSTPKQTTSTSPETQEDPKHLVKQAPLLFFLSAFTENSGKQLADSLSQYLTQSHKRTIDNLLKDLAFTLSKRRSILPYKAVVAADSPTQLIDALTGKGLKYSKFKTARKIGFVFTGQGAQWHAMGRELINQYPCFRRSLVLSDECLKEFGASFSILSELARDSPTTRVGNALVAQPLTTAIQIALVDLLGSWNITPARVTGHSSGEIAAAYCAGALKRAAAMTLSYHRGRAAAKVASTKQGAMLAVNLSKDEILLRIAQITQGKLDVACVNSPTNVTVSGDAAAILELSSILHEQGITARKLAVEVAYHSHHMELVADEYSTALQNIQVEPQATVRFYSSVTGSHASFSELCPAFWVANLVKPVQFLDAMQSLIFDSDNEDVIQRGAQAVVDTLIEIGPHSALQSPIKQIVQAHPALVPSGPQYFSALIRHQDAVRTCQYVAGQLSLRSWPVDFNAVNFPDDPGRCTIVTDLPPYPWNHSQLYWAHTTKGMKRDLTPFPRSDLLGTRINGMESSEPRWRNIVRPSEIPWINDHVVQSNTVYPAAGFLAMAIEAVYQHVYTKTNLLAGYHIREVTIGHALIISHDAEEVETMLSLRPHTESLRSPSDIWHEFCISSSVGGSVWAENCRGLISVQKTLPANDVESVNHWEGNGGQLMHYKTCFESKCDESIDVRRMYEKLNQIGLRFGPLFTNVRSIRTSSNKSIANVSVPDTAASMPAKFEYSFNIHPAFLDSCFHAVFPIDDRFTKTDNGTPVPTFIENIFVAHGIERRKDHVFEVYAEKQEAQGQCSYSITAFSQDQLSGRPAIALNGLTFATLAKAPEVDKADEELRIYYQTHWQPDPSFWSNAQANALTASFRKAIQPLDHIAIQEQAAFFYAEEALKSLTDIDVKLMLPHYQIFISSLKKHCQCVCEGQLGLITTCAWPGMDAKQREETFARVASLPGGNLLCPIGENLTQILRGQLDPLTVMLEDDRLEKYYRTYEQIQQSYQQTASYVRLLSNKTPGMSILEVGAGTGGATMFILEALTDGEEGPMRFADYDFTDISAGFFDKAQKKFERWGEQIRYRKLDVEQDPLSQGFGAERYDLIIAANVIHATKCVKDTLRRLKSLLKLGGTLILLEITVKTLHSTLTFGPLPGWWASEDDTHLDGPLRTDGEWDDMLRSAGFTGANAILWDTDHIATHQGSVIISTTEEAKHEDWPLVTIVTDYEVSPQYVQHLQLLLDRAGIQHLTKSLHDCEPARSFCIVLSELGQPMLGDPSPKSYSAIKRILLDSAGVLWVTKGALVESATPQLSLVTGLARTVRLEKGDTPIITIDLDDLSTAPSTDAADKIFAVFVKSHREFAMSSTAAETEYAVRNGQVMVPRIVEDQSLNAFMSTKAGSPIIQKQVWGQQERPLKIRIRTPGLLDTIEYIDNGCGSDSLPTNTVKIDVKASGINFRDVMTALGQIHAYPLGCECSGVVLAVGSSVKNLRRGDRVVATCKTGSFCNILYAQTEETELIPEHMPFAVAAALPVAYMTAYWAVKKIGRVAAGESVLVHAGSGGVGQAIISLCQLVGAQIFVTVGSAEKKQLLITEYHIPTDHIFSSRDGTFFEGIKAKTKGRGVDVIINSLSGEGLRLSWNCVAPFGRFVELGKRDFTINTRLEMQNFAKNISFTGLDVPLDSHIEDKRQIWQEIMDLYDKGAIKAPSPITIFGVSELEKALRTMQSGKHMGKMILMPKTDEVVPVSTALTTSQLLRADASYLLVGGLGGIGRAIALWMFATGARSFIFASPTGDQKPKAKQVVAQLREKGAQVAVFECDVANKTELDNLLVQTARTMPPIHGMIHAALVSKADLFGRMNLQDYNDVMRPKVDGIWNLHNGLSNAPLDFFIMLSSMVGTVGDPSQAAYVAASVFQDAFANYRNRKGLPAVTLDLGKVVDIGIVAEKLAARKGVRGLWSRDMLEDEVMALIQSAITRPLRVGESGFSLTGLRAWSENADPVFQSPLFSHFRHAARKSLSSRGSAGTSRPRIRESLKQATSFKEASLSILGELLSKTSGLLMVPLEEINASKSLIEYGMDSLVAVELRNWMLRELDVAMPILELLANTSLDGLSKRIAGKSTLIDSSVVGNQSC